MIRPGPRNSITDVAGILVGNAEMPPLTTGTTVVIPERVAGCAVDVRGGGPGTRDTEALDPAATGLLAVALGEATKTVPYVTDALKAYAFTVRFGQATNTDDAEGEVISTSDRRPTDDTIRAALRAFDVLHAGAGPGGTDIARPATFIASGGVIGWRDLTDNYRVRPRPADLLAAVRSLRGRPD